MPTGTVTFFFSDIEGSTRLLETLGSDYDDLLERHHEIVRATFDRYGAVEVGSEGDSFFAVFPSAADAVAGAVAIQRALAAEQWPQASTLRVRMGLHTGEARIAGGSYAGLDVHRAARIMAAAHGRQILISETTRALVERDLSDGLDVHDLGEHRLRDLSGRERLFQLCADGLPADFPPPRTVDVTPNNLPTQPSELVGREAELSAIREHLGSPSVRLLTLTGPGGIGKTRLAIQAAADESDRFGDGLFFVDLSAARDAAGALQAIVGAVRLTPSDRVDLRDALAQELKPRHLLLVLDNFEQVMDAARDVAALLQHAPKLKVLVTSRQALSVRGEQVFPVAPLSLPDRHAARAAEDVSRYAAVRLFVERAQQVRPSFRLTDDNAAAVAEICARLDGVPLAIELAAARAKLFSPAELRERLRSRLELLRGGARDLPERHRTLRSTIEWSYELLDDDERSLFQLLSVFPSARVEAVEEVAGKLAPLAHVDVVDRIASLVDKSLVRSLEDERAQRVSMLDTIREYAADRLASESTLGTARRAHAEYFVEFAQARRGELEGREREAAFDALASELENLHAAWRYFADGGDLARLKTLFDVLWPLHSARGWYHGAVALTNDLLAALSSSAPALDRAEEELTLRMSVARGLLALRGYTEEVEALYREALALSAATGTAPKQLPVLKSLASYYLYRGEMDKTIAVGREVLKIAEHHGDASVEVEGHLILGPALAFVGETTAGLDHLDRAIALFDPERDGRARFRLGPNPGVAARAVSGLLHWLSGYPDGGLRRAASAVELGRTLGHPYSLAYATFHVGLLELWNQQLEAASERARDVLRIAEDHDYPIWRAVGLVLHGVITAALGRAEDGLAQAKEGVSLYENLKTPPVFWAQLLALQAEAFALAGRVADALELVERAAAVAEEGSFDSAELKVQKAGLLVSLGDGEGAESCLLHAFEEAGAAGARMTQLKAATRLARLAHTAGGRDATGMLREVVEAFTEGFDTPQLLEARAVLNDAATRS
ncbi:MAG: NB-ARC domain-containing protein [Actinomycetota bacterium]|nr:NB-ARC domain-containing protein [Actinomycetota bacterium]